MFSNNEKDFFEKRFLLQKKVILLNFCQVMSKYKYGSLY